MDGANEINNDLLKTEIYNDSRLLLTCYPFNNKRTLSKKEILDEAIKGNNFELALTSHLLQDA